MRQINEKFKETWKEVGVQVLENHIGWGLDDIGWLLHVRLFRPIVRGNKSVKDAIFSSLRQRPPRTWFQLQ